MEKKLIGKIFLRMSEKGRLCWIPDPLYLKCMFWIYIGKRLNLKNPETFNEKLQWLKLHDRKPIYSRMVDKYEAKKYVANIIGEQYIIPTLGVWNRFEDIDFTKLPDQFVLKCTHDSGGLVVCRDKKTLDMKKTESRIEATLRRNYYYWGREWPYKNIKPRIIAETYMEDSTGCGLTDYKLFCFNGKVLCSLVGRDRFSATGLTVTFFDREWNRLPFERYRPISEKAIPMPKQYHNMVLLAEKLSKDITFVRADFYEIDGHLYFGELTLYPGSGMYAFTPEEWDYRLGKWITLP